MTPLTEHILRSFKEIYCDENPTISKILQTKFRHRLVPPILDVGAGLGDIARSAFSDFETILLDISHFPNEENPLHTRVQKSFFDYEPPPGKAIGTIFLGHVLQYLDQDLAKLKQKLTSLNPQFIISVENDNTGAFGEIIRWSLEAIPSANPELHVDAFPDGYVTRERIGFSATLSCPNFEVLAEHLVPTILDAQPTGQALQATEEKLRSLFPSPSITFQQTVFCYDRLA